jgi:hypothetical protein
LKREQIKTTTKIKVEFNIIRAQNLSAPTASCLAYRYQARFASSEVSFFEKTNFFGLNN